MVKACRYCRRYRRSCGRPHTEETRSDWGRADNGETEPVDLVAALKASVDAATARRRAAYPDTTQEKP